MAKFFFFFSTQVLRGKCVGGVGWVLADKYTSCHPRIQYTTIQYNTIQATQYKPQATVTSQRHSGHVSGSASCPVYKHTNTQIHMETNLKYTDRWSINTSQRHCGTPVGKNENSSCDISCRGITSTKFSCSYFSL